MNGHSTNIDYIEREKTTIQYTRVWLNQMWSQVKPTLKLPAPMQQDNLREPRQCFYNLQKIKPDLNTTNIEVKNF